MTEGQRRGERIIEREMLRVGTVLNHVKDRDYLAWERAFKELCELGYALDRVHGKFRMVSVRAKEGKPAAVYVAEKAVKTPNTEVEITPRKASADDAVRDLWDLYT